MLGHLKPSLCSLGTDNKVAYRTLYCSICASLREQYSLPYSLFINNELTLVLLALKPYYEAELIAKETPCPAAAFTQKNAAASHPAIDVAAKLSVLLGWIKVVDWETDQPKFYKKYLRKILHRKVEQTLPQISEEFRQVIEEYLFLTKTNSKDEEKVRKYSGLLSRHVVLEVGTQTVLNDVQLQEISVLFERSGQLIAIADHLIDLDEDMLQSQFNPIVYRSEQQKTSLASAYYHYLQIYNRLKIACLEQLQSLSNGGIIADSFKVPMQQSFKSIGRQIQQKRPAFLADMPEYIGKLQIARQDCGSAAVEGCKCVADQGDQLSYMAGKCPCGQCCDACGGCCKGGGGCCDGCGKGCNGCCGNCNGCCSGCNNSCGSCGKSCDGCCGGCNSCCDGCNDCCGNCNGCKCGKCCEPNSPPPNDFKEPSDTLKTSYQQFFKK